MFGIRRMMVATTALLLAATPLSAQPRLSLETPAALTVSSDPANPPRESVQFTSAQLQSMLGSSFFATEANSLFQGLASFRSNIAAEMTTAFLSDSSIKRVNSVVVTTKPITATLTASGTAVGVNVSGIKATVDAKADGPLPLLCPSVNFVVDIAFTGNGSFNPSLLEVGDLQFNAVPNVRSASCSGIFGFLGNLLGSIMNGESVRSVTQDKMRQQLAQFSGFGSVPTMFSLSGININVLSRLPASPSRDKVLNTANRFLAAGALRSGLALAISLHDDFSGAGGHLIRLTASQIPVSAHLEFIGNGSHMLELMDGPGTASVRVYLRQHSFNNDIGSFTPGSFTIISSSGGTSVWGVAESALVPGLRSFPKSFGTISSSTGTDCRFSESGCSEVP